MGEEKKATKELTNMKPKQVSTVDLGANGTMFFVAKSAKGVVSEPTEPVVESEPESEETQEGENPMTAKIIEVIKAAKEETEIEYEAAEVVKQLSGARDKLTELLDSLNMDSEGILQAIENGEMDFWDVRWKVGEAIGLLIDAAKLEGILGSTVEMAAPESEEKMTEENVAKTAGAEETASTNVEEVVDTPEPAPVAAPAPVAQPAPAPAAPAPVAAVPAPAPAMTVEQITEVVKAATTAAVNEAVKPLNEKIETIEKQIEGTNEEVEKMARTRVVSKGGSPDENAPEAASAAAESVFASMMPEHLRGTVNRSE